jgi:GT2 family glycosyltransferase
MRDAFEERGVECVYTRKSVPGVTESRNKAAEMACGDILVFLEDDVVLFKDYIERLLDTFAEYGDAIGGVGGIIENDYAPSLKQFVERVIFLPFGLTGFREGRILRSGFATEYGSTGRRMHGVQEVDFLLGGVSAYRRQVFEEFRFSNRYRSKSGYGQGEDKEFSFRVSRKYRLVVNPEARLYHYPAPKSNFNRYIRGRAVVLSRYYFFRDNLKRSPVDWLFFWYAMTGYTLYQLALALMTFRKQRWDRVRGIASGVRDIIRRRPLDSL